MSAIGATESKQLLWGDTHLHTSYSFDAFLNNNLSADPDTAFRWAKGLPVIHPYHRARVQLSRPLDFLVVSDHAELLGALRDIYYNGIERQDAGVIGGLTDWYTARVVRDAIDERRGAELFAGALPVSADPRAAAEGWKAQVAGAFRISDGIVATSWQRSVEIADSHNVPGQFTSFIGWEWSSIPGGANLHRVVFTSADGAIAGRFQPFASSDSPYPEDLWRWLEATSAATGAEFVAIPHNSNISKGLMFDDRSLRGEPMTADYVRRRARWEPVVEITQIKGDSETHPALSPEDEFADFEHYPFYIQQAPEPYVAAPGDFVRSALRSGLALGASLGTNPYAFGVIGSTDSHSGLASPDETNFWGKMATDSTPETKSGFSIAGGPSGWNMSAQGLAAVWASENTREAILAAFKRREVYATTGPRIQVRLFAGNGFSEADVSAPGLLDTGLDAGVPMGGELDRADLTEAMQILVVALRDPEGANLDRIQIVKGWLDAQGQTHERIFDVAWSGARAPGEDGRLPPVGNTVDRRTGRYTNSIGDTELRALWQDPEFDPAQPAFYYARVLEIPTPRHSLLDALALGIEPSADYALTLQERAYSSPVWYRP
ncbi:MAG: DUF3604 domain-containing protein [Pseudomonadales bacterium]